MDLAHELADDVLMGDAQANEPGGPAIPAEQEEAVEKKTRSKAMSLGNLYVARRLYVARVAQGKKCGAGYLIAKLKEDHGLEFTRTRAQELHKKLAGGATPEQVFAEYGKGKGRKATKLTAELRDKVGKDIAANRGNTENSIRALAKRHKVSATTVTRVIKKSKFKVEKKVVVPRTSAKTKQKRADACRQFLGMRDSGALSAATLVFSDECWFEICPKNHNAQNQRVYTHENDTAEEKAALKQKPVPQRSAGVMVFAAMSARKGGFVTRPHLYGKGEIVKQENYEKTLQSATFPQLRKACPSFFWTQDGAPSHRAKGTLEYLKGATKAGELGGFVDIWPPCSPDLNPCDFWLWAHLKQKLYNTTGRYPHDAYAQLQDSIFELFEEISMGDVEKACLSFWGKALWVAEHDGAFIVDKAYKKPKGQKAA